MKKIVLTLVLIGTGIVSYGQDTIRTKTEKAVEVTRQTAKKVGSKVKQGAEIVGEEVSKDAKIVGRETKRVARIVAGETEKVYDKTKTGVKKAAEDMKKD